MRKVLTLLIIVVVFLLTCIGMDIDKTPAVVEVATKPIVIGVKQYWWDDDFYLKTVKIKTTTPKKNVDISCPQFEGLFKQYGLLPVETFSYIAWRESRCRIKAINALWDDDGNMTYHLNKNKTWDSGLLQINSSHKTITKQVCGGGLELLLNIDCNLKVAKYLLDNGGLGNWGM